MAMAVRNAYQVEMTSVLGEVSLKSEITTCYKTLLQRAEEYKDQAVENCNGGATWAKVHTKEGSFASRVTEIYWAPEDDEIVIFDGHDAPVYRITEEVLQIVVEV